MILEIPKDFIYYSDVNNSQSNYAYEEDGNLIIIGNVSFERLMLNLLEATKDSRCCFYCGCKLTKKNRTVDHKYPLCYGGITIPRNLEYSCKKCNEDKSNLTTNQYMQVLSINDCNNDVITEFKKEFIVQNERILEARGTCLPRHWTTILKRARIYADVDFTDISYKGKRYKKIKSFYKKYKKMPRPIIISSNNVLLDGFLILMFAKNKAKKKIPAIVMENVIVK